MSSSVDDVRSALYDIWDDPTLSAHILKNHEQTIGALHSAASKSIRTRKSNFPDPDSLLPEVATLQKNLDSSKLTSWRLQTDAVIFMRTPKNSDHNVLERFKISESSAVDGNPHQAFLTVSVYTRVSWGPSYVHRSSQHALLSSQTLHDLLKVIPCTSNSHAPGGVEPISASGNGWVICIENYAYGDGSPDQEDYAEGSSSFLKGSTTVQETQFSSLSIRVNEPYWLLHQGGCDHFIVFDQIRLRHSSDPPSGYPLTSQIIPPLLDLCRACGKVPAVWSIVGDIRLGESPCMMCGPCWRNMGDPLEAGIVVVRLP
ncbi:uncharacterized protein LACBIDRAFT_313793 [Laccaria bicolor S238N-H82]|uniref:Predicted protein n=1 Tax=Laccaria bicolor (strain S238N-H82 / ATCC MYA-4686) TaxID=486041 RepID=B0D0V1_LACBS|nr:uncharacterized protein LACBIDRAFT_313793 [Laccaria bicolor S238N-H82]EDR11887.1 predicted protein [Laccaria bicolor S238N-H82]|eukprot:XP_001877784.1 predicted protein [Laccaria bicolor S238N-H82]